MGNTNTGSRIKELRTRRRMSQTDLASILSVAPSTISAYELNERTPSPEKLIRLADLFHTTVDYLLCRQNNSPINEEDLIYIGALSEKQKVFLRKVVQDLDDLNQS